MHSERSKDDREISEAVETSIMRGLFMGKRGGPGAVIRNLPKQILEKIQRAKVKHFDTRYPDN